jgi:hypothetical protein
MNDFNGLSEERSQSNSHLVNEVLETFMDFISDFLR